NQQRIATARELMTQAEQLRSNNIRQALQLGIVAEQIDSTPSTRASLATTLASSMLAATVPDEQGVMAVAFSPDGHTLATVTSSGDLGGGGGTVQLWDLTNHSAPTRTATLPEDHYHYLDTLAFSPDGHTLATATSGFSSDAGAVQLWDLTN